jgi:hypothetical protein
MNWCLVSIGILASFDNIDLLGRNYLNIISSIDWNNYAIHLFQRSMEYFRTSEIDRHKAFRSISYNNLLNDLFFYKVLEMIRVCLNNLKYFSVDYPTKLMPKHIEKKTSSVKYETTWLLVFILIFPLRWWWGWVLK